MNKLNNITKKLKEDKKATIVYLGGSVTGGFGSSNAAELSWRALSGKHFKECFPDAEINLVNAGVGGTGTGYARFRLENDVLAHNPDLVFIEFAINDCYEGYKLEQSYLFYESLLHTIHNFNDEIDIAIVIITDRGNMRNGVTDIGKAQFEIAERYGLPVVDIVHAVEEDMKANPEHNEDYFLKDWAHPNDTGYAFYATVANKFIDDYIVNGEYNGIVKHTVPKPKMDNLILGKTVALFPNEFKIDVNNDFEIRELSENNFALYSENEGDSIEFDFEGSHFSIWVQLGGENSVEGGADKVECYVDGELLNTITVKSCSSATIHRPIIHAVEDKKHRVVLKNASGGKLCIRKIFFA